MRPRLAEMRSVKSFVPVLVDHVKGNQLCIPAGINYELSYYYGAAVPDLDAPASCRNAQRQKLRSGSCGSRQRQSVVHPCRHQLRTVLLLRRCSARSRCARVLPKCAASKASFRFLWITSKAISCASLPASTTNCPTTTALQCPI